MATSVRSSSRLFRGVGAFFGTELRVQLHESTAVLTSMIVQGVLLVFVTILILPLAGRADGSAHLLSVPDGPADPERGRVRPHRSQAQRALSRLADDGRGVLPRHGRRILLAYFPPILVLALITELLVTMSWLTWLVVILTAGAVWIFAVSVGYIISTFFRDMRAIWPYASLFYNLFGVLPPVFYPLHTFTPALQPLALVLPPSAATAIINQVRIGGVLSTDWAILAVTALIVEAVATFVIAVWWARRTVRME